MKVGFEHPLPTGMLIIALHKIHKLFQNKSIPLKHYKVLQHPGGFPSIRDEKMSLLGDRKCDRPGFFSFFGYFSSFLYKEKKKSNRKNLRLKKDFEIIQRL